MALTRRLRILTIITAVAVAAGGCTGSNGTADNAPKITERTFAVDVGETPVRVGFLSALLTNVSVMERVQEGSGEVVDPPKLRGTLKIKNTSEDRTARLVGGRLRYLGPDGKAIALAAGREAPTFTFYSYGDRIDPGKETSLSLDVPFPAAAVKDTALGDMQLELTYVPTPFVTEAATIPTTLAAGG